MWFYFSISSTITNGKHMNPLNYLVSWKSKSLLHQTRNISYGNNVENYVKNYAQVLVWICLAHNAFQKLKLRCWGMHEDFALTLPSNGWLQTWLDTKLSQLGYYFMIIKLTDVFTSSFLTDEQSILFRGNTL